MKNNSEKFFEKTARMIDLFYEPICKHDDNYENEKRKILNQFKKYPIEEQLEDVLTWQFLIDYAFLGLNREKIENSVNVNWDNYVPQNLKAQFRYADLRPSKAPYFKEWVKVQDCKSKYLTEGSDFWIKRIRNSCMHGNFVFDYDNIAKQRIKIFEGNNTSTDLKMDVLILGLHEFIEDNFHNVYHEDYGVVDKHVNVFMPDLIKVENREELLEILKNKLIICTRDNKDGYNYDGNTLFDSTTGLPVSREKNKKDVMDRNTQSILDSVDGEIKDGIKIAKLSENAIDTLVWVLENKYNIYKAPKQKNKIMNALRQYTMPMKSINKLLREFNCYCGGIHLDKKEYKATGLDPKKTISILIDENENIKNTFTVLRLYRFLYRMQNKGFEDIDYSKFDCEKSFLVSDEEEMQKRIDKNKLKMPDKEAENKAYIETMRNALAHGNVDIKYIVEKDKLIPLFELKDEFANRKTGEVTTVSVYSPGRTLDAFLELADYDAFDILGFDLKNKEIDILKEDDRTK